MAKDLKKLMEERQKLEAAILEAEAAQRTEVRNSIESILAEASYSLSDVFPDLCAKRPRKAGDGLYQDPENPENTWGGRGRKPLWLIAKVGAGAKLEDFKIAR
jgi:DNA-binding protein H-NS